MKKLSITAIGAVAALALVLVSASGAGIGGGVVSAGTVSIGSLNTTPGTVSGTPANDTSGATDADPGMKVAGAIKQFHGKPVSTPAPAGQAVTGSTAFGFDALSHRDQRLADNGNQFSIEPPDQALCVGGGYVLEGVNLAFRVYTTAGAPVTNPVSYNQFFTNDHSINRTVAPIGTAGWFLSDPKCYYDSDTGRFFMTILGINPDGYHAVQFIAVTQTGDPTGSWYKYSFDTTDDGTDGTPNNPGCSTFGCFGDQPLIGADKYGFFVTTNEFGTGFNGAQVYAMSKVGLENNTPGPLVHIVTTGLQEGPAYSVQPSTSPDGNYDTANGGTEYFLSALDFNGTLDGRIAAWTLTNTSSLATATPNVRLQSAVMKSESYGQPGPVEQKAGPSSFGGQETLNSNDDRMNQVVYAGGLVWGGVNTIVQTADGSTRTGIAWFAANVNAKTHGNLDAHIKQQGYVSVNGENVLFPAIGVTSAGKAVMAFTLAGPDYYPSAAWLTLTGGDGKIHVSGVGAGPEDGFTGAGGTTSRWGDYGAAVPGANGSIWIASEYIPNDPRTVNANWGTFITSVTP
jgi:hypothetical protein